MTDRRDPGQTRTRFGELLARPTFGSTVQCRRCRGEGLIAHAADPAATRERARMRRQGQEVPDPARSEPCPVCKGAGVVPASIADRGSEPRTAGQT